MSTEGDHEPMDTGQNQETAKTNLSVVLEILEVVLDKWYEIGTKLGVDSSVLHILDRDYRNAETKEEKNVRIQMILNAWAGREGVEMVELVNVVRATDEEGAADRLQQVVKDLLPGELIKAQVKAEPVEGSEIKEEGNKEKGDEVGDEVNQEVNQEGDEGDEGGNKEKDDDAMDVKVGDNKEKDDDAITEVKGEDPPDIETQRKEMQAALKQQLKNGEVWYLVDIRWIKQWKKYVGYDTWDQSSAGKESANPGPLDNSNLFKDESLREHLMDELDYYLVPESAWNKLSTWYQLSSGSKVLSRRVVEYGLYMKHCKVEVYLLEFKMCIHPDINNIKKRQFSRADTVADLEAAIREEFQIPSETECRVWHRYMTHTYELLSKSDQSLQDAGLYNGQTIVLEKKKDDGSWPRTTSTVSSTTHSTRSSDNIGATSTRSSGSSYSSYGNSSSYWPSYNNQPSDPGLCGLSNLGNTCFMNSALQCLSNTPPLTEYFLGTEAGYKPYKKHINADNPLGMGGAIAEAYGGLLEDIWSGKCSVAAPRQFKTSVGRYAPQFVGYAQHDSQELLAFLLDGLHEDLNLVKKKPYVDMTVATKGRDEEDIAKETWYKYLQRNQSVIVKLFQAQLRSTLICPKCTRPSLTFDPFMFLSLPLPVKNSRTVCVRLVRTNPSRPITKYKLIVPKRGTVWDIKTKLATLCDIEASHLAVVDVYNSRFHRIYSDRDTLSHIMDKDDIFCYQLENENVGNRKMVHVPIYMRAQTERQYSSSQYSRYCTLFGLPTVAYVPAECTYRTLYTAIVSKMGACVKLWSEVKDQIKSSDDNNQEDIDIDGNVNGANENGNENGDMKNGNEVADNGSSADPPLEGMDVEEAANNEEKSEERNKDVGERDLFKLVVVNSYGSQEIKKLTDDPKRTLQLSGSTYIACDWEEEVREKCYNDDMSKHYEEHESCHDDPIAKGKNIQLMDCFELFTVKETLGKGDQWYCPECKEHVQASKKFDLWTLPDVLVIHLKRFSYDKYWRDKLDVLVDFPVSGLNLSSLVKCPDAAEPIYDLYAVSNHFGGMGGGHYTAYAKNKNDKKWYNFDDSHVSETTEDRLVSSAAYVLFYRRRDDQSRPTKRSILDRSLSQSFAEEDRELKAKYQREKEDQESKRSRSESEVFSEADEDNQTPPSNADEDNLNQTASTSLEID